MFSRASNSSKKQFPHLSPTIQSAVHVRRAGDISAQQLGMYLLGEAKKLGARVLMGEVTAIETDGQGVKAVEVLAHGTQHTIETRTFINAAGPFCACDCSPAPCRTAHVLRLAAEGSHPGHTRRHPS